MPSISVQKQIAAPPERVWEILANPESLPGVIDSVTSVERLDDNEGFVVGTRWRETRRVLGRQASQEIEAVAIESRRSFVTEAESNGTRYTTVHTLEPVGNGTLLTVTFTGTPLTALSRVVSAVTTPIFRSATRKAIESDVAALAAAAEREPTGETAD